MDVGFALPQFDFSVPGEQPLSWPTLRAWARRAEDLGFASVWLADHLFLDVEKYGGPPGRHGGFEPTVALAAVARETSRVRLGTLVLCTQLRPPGVLAKALATLDRLSGGRLVVGMGAGWYEPEFDAAGLPFERPKVRFDQLTEAVLIVRALFGGEPVSFRGQHYEVHEAPGLPPPVQAPPPILVGGRGDRVLDVAARHADGWNTVWSWTVPAYRERLAALDRACERVGRDPATVTRSLGLGVLVGEDERDVQRRWERVQRLSPPGVADGTSLETWRAGRLVGTVEQVREQVAGWEEVGVDELVVNAAALPFSVIDEDDVAMAAAATLGSTLGPP